MCVRRIGAFSKRPAEDSAGILGSPDGAVRIPVYFRKNSLSVFAHVRKVKERET